MDAVRETYQIRIDLAKQLAEPTYYIPQADVKMALLRPNAKRSFCEYKGAAHYWDILAGSRTSIAAAWSYPSPSQAYSALRDHLALYAHRVDACFADGERVQAQEGDFYGGWVTTNTWGLSKAVPAPSGGSFPRASRGNSPVRRYSPRSEATGLTRVARLAGAQQAAAATAIRIADAHARLGASKGLVWYSHPPRKRADAAISNSPAVNPTAAIPSPCCSTRRITPHMLEPRARRTPNSCRRHTVE